MNKTPEILLVNRALIIDDDKLLLVRRSRTDERNADLWEFPGGKVDDGEDLLEGLHREVLEETGLSIEPHASLVHVESERIEQGKYQGKLYVALFHSTRVMSGEVVLSDEHEHFVWSQVDEALQCNLTAESKRAIAAFRHLL